MQETFAEQSKNLRESNKKTLENLESENKKVVERV
jgi:hypothetical protein